MSIVRSEYRLMDRDVSQACDVCGKQGLRIWVNKAVYEDVNKNTKNLYCSDCVGWPLTDDVAHEVKVVFRKSKIMH